MNTHTETISPLALVVAYGIHYGVPYCREATASPEQIAEAKSVPAVEVTRDGVTYRRHILAERREPDGSVGYLRAVDIPAHANAPVNDCLAETLPQSDSVKSHYAQERVRNAAPELMEALQAIADARMPLMSRDEQRAFDNHQSDCDAYRVRCAKVFLELQDAARAAIAKATNA